jgi:hypothetical protein
MERSHTKRALGKQVPVKRIDVAYVKYDAVPFGNRPVVQRLWPNQAKNVIGARAGLKQAGVKVVSNADSSSSSSHGVFPFF